MKKAIIVLIAFFLNASLFAYTGLKIDFIIDEDFVIAEILGNASYIENKAQGYSSYKNLYYFCEKAKNIADFQEYAKIFMLKGYFSFENLKSYELSDFFQKTKSIIEYQLILNDLLQYKRYCQKQWDDNFYLSYQIMRELTNIDFQKVFKVYLTHPNLYLGQYEGNNTILLGKEVYDNYVTITIWHEILHSYFKNNPITHAIIQFIDQELDMRLNSEYYFKRAGHSYLEGLMEYFYEDWLDYETVES